MIETLAGRHLLTLGELSAAEIEEVLAESARLKGRASRAAEAMTLALIFKKPSTRTRVSFEVAMGQLGGRSIFLASQSTQLSRGESTSDTARVMGRYVDAIAMRTFDQDEVEELAASAGVPVVNALTDLYHPCQVLADLRTVLDKKGRLDGLAYAYVGDGNNMTHTWMLAAAILGLDLRVACPEGRGPDPRVFEHPLVKAHPPTVTLDPKEAVDGADVILTDTWFSMGQDETPGARAAFQPYQVNPGLLQKAHPEHIFMHCLPAHVGDEVTDDVIYGEHSVVFDEAENRLHVQKAWLAAALGLRT